MRLIEYTHKGVPRLGVVLNNLIYDVAGVYEGAPSRMLEFVQQGEPFWTRLRKGLSVADQKQAVGSLGEISLCAPLPNPRKLLCVAANYQAHIVEAGFEHQILPVILLRSSFLNSLRPASSDRRMLSPPVPVMSCWTGNSNSPS